MHTEVIKFWLPFVLMAMSGLSAFVWLQADVRAGEVKADAQALLIIEKRLENSKLKGIQTELRIFNAEQKIELKTIKQLLEQIRIQTK